MAIVRVLRRYFAGVIVGLIAALVFFQTRGAAQLRGVARLGPGSRSSQPPAPSARMEVKDAAPLLERNPFDSGSRARDAAAALADPLAWPACDGVRVSIVTESSDPLWSLTSVQAFGEPRARLRRVGDDVGERRVAFIGYNPKQLTPSVWLQGGGDSCQSSLYRGREGASAKPSAVSTERHVDRAVVEQVVSNPISLRAVRVVPEQRAGEIIGLRLFGIRPGSLLSALGLQNGDRLETINGFSVASPEQALTAYARLRTASRLSVRLTRSERPVQLDLNIN